MGMVRFMAVPQEGASIPAISILTVANMMVLVSTNLTTPIRTFVHTIPPIQTLTLLVGLEMDQTPPPRRSVAAKRKAQKLEHSH